MIASIIILVMYAINLGITLAKNGEPKGGKYNFWAELISTFIMFMLLYWAGTFDKLLNLN
jgi:hypothetical protein